MSEHYVLPYSLISPHHQKREVLVYSFFFLSFLQTSTMHIPSDSSVWKLSKSHLTFSVKWKQLSVSARKRGSSCWRMNCESAEPQAWWNKSEAVGGEHSQAINYQLQQEQSLVLSSIWPRTPCCSALSCLVSSTRYGRSCNEPKDGHDRLACTVLPSGDKLQVHHTLAALSISIMLMQAFTLNTNEAGYGMDLWQIPLLAYMRVDTHIFYVYCWVKVVFYLSLVLFFPPSPSWQ